MSRTMARQHGALADRPDADARLSRQHGRSAHRLGDAARHRFRRPRRHRDLRARQAGRRLLHPARPASPATGTGASRCPAASATCTRSPASRASSTASSSAATICAASSTAAPARTRPADRRHYYADSLGGRFIWTQSTELRFPLPLSPDLGLSGRDVRRYRRALRRADGVCQRRGGAAARRSRPARLRSASASRGDRRSA